VDVAPGQERPVTAAALAPALAAAAVLGACWPRRPGPRARLPVVVARPANAGRSIGRRERIAALAVAGIGLALLSPMLAAVAIAGGAIRWVTMRRDAARRFDCDLVEELPEVVDLLSLAASAGLTIPLAVEVVGDRGTGRVAAALGAAASAADRGDSLADALERVAFDLGDHVRPLGRVLAGSLRDGPPVAPALDRLASEVRLDRRRAAEERARQLPVRLLFPLVACVLPAFALLTVVPLLAGALTDLPW